MVDLQSGHLPRGSLQQSTLRPGKNNSPDLHARPVVPHTGEVDSEYPWNSGEIIASQFGM